MNEATKAEVVEQFTRASPPLTVGGFTILGYPMSDWVLMLTAVYTIFQILFLVDKALAERERRNYERKRRKSEEASQAFGGEDGGPA